MPSHRSRASTFPQYSLDNHVEINMKSIRRKQSRDRDIESNVTSASEQVGNNSTIGNGGSSGIDSFLHRLNNDADLKNMKKRSLAGKDSDIDGASGGYTSKSKSNTTTKLLTKRILTSIVGLIMLGLIYDTLTSPPETRILGSQRIHDFLFWVKENPGTGAAAFIFVYGFCVALLLPGTPLTLGGGYVYKVAYGWVGGVAMATFTSMCGSLVGSVSCFLMGRYIMRDRVRKWGRKYPLFDAIDIAVSDNGFKIMCLLYLTPILPLGPVSYLVGTTSMPVMRFAAAKIAALPLMLLYVVIGASTDTFLGAGSDHSGSSNEGGGETSAENAAKAVKKIHGVDSATHKKMVLFGVCLSIISMSLVSHFVKKELYKVSVHVNMFAALHQYKP